MDLADLSSLSKYNKHKYLLNVIDICISLRLERESKHKTGTSITCSLKTFFKIENQLQYNQAIYCIC